MRLLSVWPWIILSDFNSRFDSVIFLFWFRSHFEFTFRDAILELRFYFCIFLFCFYATVSIRSLCAVVNFFFRCDAIRIGSSFEFHLMLHSIHCLRLRLSLHWTYFAAGRNKMVICASVCIWKWLKILTRFDGMRLTFQRQISFAQQYLSIGDGLAAYFPFAISLVMVEQRA